MFSKMFFFAVTLFMISFAGCKNDDPTDPGGDPIPPAKVMAVHASPGGPALDIYVDTTRVQSRLEYGNNTGYVNVAVGIHSLKATIAGTQTVVVSVPVFPVTTSLVATVFAADTGTAITTPYFFDTLATPAPGKARLRFIHMAVKGTNLEVIDSVNATTSTTIFPSTLYLAGTRFTDINAGVHNFLIVRTAGPAQIVMARLTTTLVAGKNYTLWAKGLPGVTGSLGVSADIIANN